jgi:hypothetical protein
MATMIHAMRKLSLPADLSSWMKYIFIAGALVAFLYFAPDKMSNWLVIPATGIITLALGLATGIIHVKSWRISLQPD